MSRVTYPFGYQTKSYSGIAPNLGSGSHSISVDCFTLQSYWQNYSTFFKEQLLIISGIPQSKRIYKKFDVGSEVVLVQARNSLS